MTAVDLLATEPVDPIVNGRYSLPSPDGKGRKTYTRATNIAKLLDDDFKLQQWKQRSVALGVARTPSIATAVCADHDNKDIMNRLCEQAITVAGGTEKRDLGTALHRLIERHDRHEVHHDGEWRDHIAAYDAALNAHRLTVQTKWCEVVLVNETYGIAGRADRLLRDPEGRLVVADLKTGGFKSWLSWATQFAIYATSTHWWNEKQDRLEPIDPGLIRQDHSLAIHLPAQETPPHCQIHALSVPAGLDAMLMALEVRRMRALDRLPALQATTYHHPQLLDQMVASIEEAFDPDAMRISLQVRIDFMKSECPDAARALIARWPEGVPMLKKSDAHTVQQLTAIERAITQVEADFGFPF